MSTQIAIICDKTRWSSKLQAMGEKLVGRKSHPEMPYHVAWLKDGRMFDMNTKFREVDPKHYSNRKVLLFNSPVDISIEYLESMVGKRSYGYIDVALYFLFVPLGLNWLGTHCAEAINDDLWFHSYRTPWIPYGAPPDPAAVLYWLEEKAV